MINGLAAQDASLAPAVDWTGAQAHAHAVQFYEDDAFLLDELGRFVGAALGAGDVAVVLATPAHRDGIAERLAARGLDAARAAREGRYLALDAAETLAACTTDGEPDATAFADIIGGVISRAAAAARRGDARVAVFGELVALLAAEGKFDAAIRLEHLWNDLAATHAFHLRCAYPIGHFGREEDGAPIRAVCAAHTHVIPLESYTLLGDDGDRLRTIALLQQRARALESEVNRRKVAQRTLRERNRELQAALAARDAFLSVAAHELKTPVTSLRAFAQLLLRDTRRAETVPPERLAAGLDAIERQTGTLNRLVERLLDAAAIDSGTLRLDLVRTDLVGLVRATLAQHDGEPDHRLAFAGPARLDADVDPVRFEQVVENLVSNAIKFSLPGGTVAVELAADGAGAICLHVTDEGVGVPPDERERVFDRCSQAHGERHLSGMGLGLYIAREIVELHGGRVRLEAPEDGGTRVVVTLPGPRDARPDPATDVVA